MYCSCCKLFFRFGMASLLFISPLYAGEASSSTGMKSLWQIGIKDKNTAEFALGPNGYAQFGEDPVFMVGVSDAKKDWPYVQPGPQDAWAKSRQHSFSICFALKDKPSAKCVLTIALVDAQYQSPPMIGIEVNGRSIGKHRPPAGKSDAALGGDPSKGRASEFSVDIPADAFQSGMNEISITTLSGSWMVYDSLNLQSPQNAELGPISDFASIKSIESLPVLVNKDGKLHQVVALNLLHHGAEASAELKIPGREVIVLPVKNGRQELSFSLSEVEKEATATMVIKAGGKILATREVTVKPVRKWVMYFLSHSHVDIGYTQLQTDVLKKQMQNLEIAQDLAKKTAGNPPGEQFKWNAEVLWPIDNYLRLASPEKQQVLIEAIKAGQIDLDAFYGNELTALCRPEELVRLVDAAGRIGKRCGVKVETAMISDVPGYTWGIVQVLASAGVKYFSVGPNPGDRIGRTLVDLGDKPFYWVSPSGKERVLCWIAGKGYANFHGATFAQAGEGPMFKYFSELEEEKYPYDYVQMRYTVNGDNGPPDTTLVVTVQKWNAKYAYPKMVISTTTQMMKDFESRYGDKLPQMKGDITPYWEDGAASSARETGLNRAAAERLAQAETLWALSDYKKYPTDDFDIAWRNALLYDEHTWGAHNSISEPDLPFVKDQWKIKQAFALDADTQSKKLLDQIAAPQGKLPDDQGRFQVFNTCSWPRTDLVILPKESSVGMVVFDAEGKPVSQQQLKNGELAFLAKDVPALGCKSYQLKKVPIADNWISFPIGKLASDKVIVQLDEVTGEIKSLKKVGLNKEFVDPSADHGLNGYLYVLGTDAKGAKTSGQASIKIGESGPQVNSQVVESDAPGCNKFTREIRVIDGLDRVDIINVIDKKPIRQKEGVHLAYPFNVPEGTVRMDLAWSVIRPNDDQLPGSCKNWFTVQRWVDVSNKDYGVTWATIDAPLVEIGGITANLIGSQTNPNAWIKQLEPSQKLYSWVMNNHWHTNYLAEQDGPTTFRYSVRPHAGGYDPVAAMRFGIEQSRPLVVVKNQAVERGLIVAEKLPENLIVAGMKPSNDGKAVIIRLYEVCGKSTETKLQWQGSEPKAVWLSNPFEEEVAPIKGEITVPGSGVVTLRVEK
jgi:alpha-mannosidase